MKFYDKNIREMLRYHLVVNGNEPVDEFCISENFVRADLVLIGKTGLKGFEIKSDYDNLFRLPTQAFIYSLYFEENTIVTTEKYIEEVAEIIPSEWGIISMSRIGELIDIRKPIKNTEISALTLMQLLTLPELKNFAKLLKVKNYTKLNKYEIIYKIWSDSQEEELVYLTCLYLRRRKF